MPHAHGPEQTGHHHGPGHGHIHAPRNFGRAFAIGTALNAGFVVVEAVFGIMSNSMALIADAGHNLSDVFGLLMAWAAVRLSTRVPSARYTYGYLSSSILAAMANAILLLVAVGAIVWEALQRLLHPEAVAEKTVIVVALVGIVINAATAFMFWGGRRDDLNVRGAFLHMMADAAVSVGVVTSGVLILATGWLWLDPVVSLGIAAVIVWGTWSLLRDSVSLALQAVPAGIDPARVRKALEALPGVASVHDLHIWPLSTTNTALTCHLVMPSGHPGDAFLAAIRHTLAHDHRIQHATLQIEIGDGTTCELAPDDVV